MDLKTKLQAILEQNPFVRLGDAVYTILYQSILRLELPVGATLSDTALAKELEISRTPVRNALTRLLEEGLLLQDKGHSFRVAPLEKEECRHLMEVRLAIEGQAAFLAAERITPAQQAALRKLMDAYAAACTAWDTEAIVTSDHAFHQAIVDAAHNPYLAEIYRQISPRVLHYRHFLFRQSGRETLGPIMELSVRRQSAVYRAVCAGYGSLAREQIERDIFGMTDIIGSWQ